MFWDVLRNPDENKCNAFRFSCNSLWKLINVLFWCIWKYYLSLQGLIIEDCEIILQIWKCYVCCHQNLKNKCLCDSRWVLMISIKYCDQLKKHVVKFILFSSTLLKLDKKGLQSHQHVSLWYPVSLWNLI